MSEDLFKRILKPGQIIRPEVSIQQAKQLIRDNFGYQVKKITVLNSYDDQNFYVETTAKQEGENGGTKRFVFKVLNSMDSENSEHVAAENTGMIYLQSRNIKCPLPERSLHGGSTYPIVEIPSSTDAENNAVENAQGTGRLHIIRLLSFVEGQILSEVKITEKILFDVGVYTAQLNETLEDFSHPGLENHDSIWWLSSLPLLQQFLYVIQSDQKRFEMVSEVLEAFKAKVIPAYPKLQKGVIHGDLNEQNLIVRKLQNGDVGSIVKPTYSIAGIIDFADLQNNYYVFELAIIIAYMMLECLKVEIDPLEGSAHFLAGFIKKRQVPKLELEILKICIAGRLCQSVVLGQYTHSLDKSNGYLLTTASSGWAALDRIWNQTSDLQLYNIWRKVIPDLP